MEKPDIEIGILAKLNAPAGQVGYTLVRFGHVFKGVFTGVEVGQAIERLLEKGSVERRSPVRFGITKRGREDLCRRMTAEDPKQGP